MATTIVIAVNNNAYSIFINDLGLTIPASSQRNLTDLFQLHELVDSEDLYNLVNTDELVINNGTETLNKTSSLDHIRRETDYEDDIDIDPHEIDGHTDVPTKPTTGSKIIIDRDGIIEWGDGPIGSSGFRKGLSFWGDPTYNGRIPLLGWYDKINSGSQQPPESLSSGSPITTVFKLFHSHVVLNILTSSGTPFTIRITGTTVDEPSGDFTFGDTEDLTITGNGYFQSAKSFVEEVDLEILEASKSCTLDIYKTTYWDNGNVDFLIKGIRLEWTPDQNNWDFDLKLYHHLNSGELYEIDSVTFFSTDTIQRAADGESGKYKRIDYDRFVNGNNMEGLIMTLDQQGIGTFFLEIKYE